ncbi:carboxymuconolactone decarboxylase family protein [Variovorax sp. WS11]|nr:carboxymuconolactone decarboxylase family protein [Variovorax sp. WS11]
MARFTVDYPYGDVLSRPGLDLRLRQLCNVGSLIAQGSVQPQLRFHMEGLLNVGGSAQDLVEVMFIATAILGFPAAINTIGIVRQILADRSIPFSPILPQADAGGSRYARGLRAFGELMQGPPSDYLASFGAITPELAQWSIEFAFGDVLARGELESKAKHLVIASMLATVGNREDALRLHLESALKVGATKEEIIEALIQVSVYAGFPAALNAFGVAAQAFQKRDDVPAVASAVRSSTPGSESGARRRQRGLAALAATSGGSGEAVVRSFEDVAPEIGQMIVEHSYGDIFSRPGLDPKTRELTACAALAGRATRTTETPLRVHINAALNVGASREEIVETLLNMAAYFGFPAVQGAMRIAGEEFRKRVL